MTRLPYSELLIMSFAPNVLVPCCRSIVRDVREVSAGQPYRKRGQGGTHFLLSDLSPSAQLIQLMYFLSAGDAFVGYGEIVCLRSPDPWAVLLEFPH